MNPGCKSVLIFGCGEAGRRAFGMLEERFDIVGFVDNNARLHGTTLFGRPVYAPDALLHLNWGRIFVASMHHREICQQLVATLGIRAECIEIAPNNDAKTVVLAEQPVCAGPPILILDEWQWSWMRLPLDQVVLEGRRQGLSFVWHRVVSASRCSIDAEVPSSGADPDAMYRKIRLWPVVHYSVCVELELATSELDWADHVHMGCVARWYTVARAVIDELHEVLARVKPRAVIAVQGYFITAAVARQLAPTIGYQFIALENTFAPERLICEPITGIAVNRTSAALMYQACRDLLPRVDYAKWLENFMDSLERSKPRDHASPVERFSWPAGRKRIVFLGQCYTDSSVLFDAHDGITAQTILRALLAYVETRSVFVFAKLHPKESGGTNPLGASYNRLTWRKLCSDPEVAQRLSENGCEHQWYLDADNNYSTSALLSDCDVVVTINSQGGLEAAGYGKDVLLLGEAFYANQGFTFDIPRIALLPVILDAVLFDGVSLADRDVAARFLYVYFLFYCLERKPETFVQGVRERLLC